LAIKSEHIESKKRIRGALAEREERCTLRKLDAEPERQVSYLLGTEFNVVLRNPSVFP
jgi:hypothetical protein